MDAVARRVQSALASPRMHPHRARARELRDRLFDQPLKQLERARRRLLEGEVDVLVLGDSSCQSASVNDTDRTLMPELIGRAVGGEVLTVAGPGFGARMYGEILRILGTLDQRPNAVVVALCFRTTTSPHIASHPKYGYARSLGELALIKSADGRIKTLGLGGLIQHPGDYASFVSLPMYTRWGGDDLTIGSFLEVLKAHGALPWPPEVERFRFDYYHGEYVLPGNPGLGHLSEFGRRLEEYGVPVAAYWTQPPLQRGEMHYPGEFEQHVRSNLAAVDSALLARTSKLSPLVQVPLDDADFEDSQNATEHFSFSGRVKIADAIADALGRGL